MKSMPSPGKNKPPVVTPETLNRQSLRDIFNWITATHLEYATPGYAGLNLGHSGVSYDNRAAEMEGLTRLMWGGAFAYACGDVPERSDDLLAGIRNGCDSKHPNYWGKVESFDQRAVEMAPLAAAIMEISDLPERLGTTAIENLCGWMAGIQDVDLSANNWRFFRVLVLKALERLGWEYDNRLLAEELAFIDSQYLGGGWYGDNTNAGRDYYNGFAFHYYSLLYARWFRDKEPERCQSFIERAREFALHYRYWFDDDGAHIAYGRSLTYRFAPSCFWPLLALFGHPEITTGEMRGLWARSLSWWFTRNIFDDLGRVTIGYAYPNLLMSEFYNSPQSPLWFLKAFFPMALPESHPFWLAGAEACRYDRKEVSDPNGLFIIQRKEGGAYMLAGAPIQHEMRNCVDKYGKFAYSSRHGLCIEAARWLSRGVLGDNILAFSKDGKQWAERKEILNSTVNDGELVTLWKPLPDCTVETRQRFTPEGERRVHVVESEHPLSFIASGYAVDGWKRGGVRFDLPAEGGEPAAIGDTLFSDITDASGKLPRGAVASAPNTNLMFPTSVVPAIQGKTGIGQTVIDTVLRYGKR